MEINQLIERITVVDFATLMALVGMVLAFVKGITETFNVFEGRNKQILTVLMSVWLVLMAVLTASPEVQAIGFTFILKLLSTIVLVFFGASGVYNFIPKDKVVEIDVTDIPDFEDMQASIVEDEDKENENA